VGGSDGAQHVAALAALEKGGPLFGSGTQRHGWGHGHVIVLDIFHGGCGVMTCFVGVVVGALRAVLVVLGRRVHGRVTLNDSSAFGHAYTTRLWLSGWVDVNGWSRSGVGMIRTKEWE